MADQLATTPAEPNVSEATQATRAAALWRIRLEAEALEAQALETAAQELVAVEQASLALKAAKKAADAKLAVAPQTTQANALRTQMEVLKAQFLNNFKPSDEKTITVPGGHKVQIRSAEPMLSITDGKKLVEVMQKLDLWDVANIKVSGDARILIPLVENGVLKGAAVIEEKNTIAMIVSKA